MHGVHHDHDNSGRRVAVGARVAVVRDKDVALLRRTWHPQLLSRLSGNGSPPPWRSPFSDKAIRRGPLVLSSSWATPVIFLFTSFHFILSFTTFHPPTLPPLISETMHFFTTAITLSASALLLTTAVPLPSPVQPLSTAAIYSTGAIVSSNDYIASHSLSLMNNEGERAGTLSKRAEQQQVGAEQIPGISTIAILKESKRH